MASSVDICNLALSVLGEAAEVTSIDPPDGEHSGHCSKWYPIALRSLLEKHGWSFATKRAKLAELSSIDASVYGKKHAFAVPSDCLKVLDVQSEEQLTEDLPPRFIPFELGLTDQNSRRAIFTDAEDPILTYITNVQTPELFPGYFVDALVILLATYLYGPIKRSDSTSTAAVNLMKLFESQLSRSKTLDAQTAVRTSRDSKRLANVIRSREV